MMFLHYVKHRLFTIVYVRDQGNDVLHNYVKHGCINSLKQKARLKTCKRPGEASSVFALEFYPCLFSNPPPSLPPPFPTYQV